eukprot:5728210-Prymnesium_polylepis.1
MRVGKAEGAGRRADGGTERRRGRRWRWVGAISSQRSCLAAIPRSCGHAHLFELLVGGVDLLIVFEQLAHDGAVGEGEELRVDLFDLGEDRVARLAQRRVSAHRSRGRHAQRKSMAPVCEGAFGRTWVPAVCQRTALAVAPAQSQQEAVQWRPAPARSGPNGAVGR